MDSKKAYKQMQDEMIDRESAYLCTEIEASAIKLLKEWHL